MSRVPMRLSFIALLVLLSSACATSTSFVTTWRARQARPLQLTGKKVVALFLGNNPSIRRVAEDALAREIVARGAQGVPAYTVLTDDDIRNEDVAKKKLADLGFSGVLAMRVVGQETEYRYEPGYWGSSPHYRQFWGGYYGWGWSRVYDPGYLVADNVVSVETLVYSFERDEPLVWAGISKTVNPDRIESFIHELAKQVAKKLTKEGLLQA